MFYAIKSIGEPMDRSNQVFDLLITAIETGHRDAALAIWEHYHKAVDVNDDHDDE